MGAMEFVSYSKGKNVNEAFVAAVNVACYDHGNSGYTGTIAEKSEFRMVDPLPQRLIDHYKDDIFGAAEAYAYIYLDDDDEEKDSWWNDKWGPCAAFQVNEDHWCFFGWASS